MDFDPAVSLRILNNERLRRNGHWGEYVDLGGALVFTSDAPLEDSNCLESFHTDSRRVDALLDIGFALLRTYDRAPAVRMTPLDRPRGAIEKALRARRMRVTERSVAMVFRGDPAAIRTNPEVEVRVASADDVLAMRDIRAPASSPAWLRRMIRQAIIGSLSEPGFTFYIGYLEGQPVSTLELLCDGGTAGIGGVATLRSHRCRRAQATLMARALRDAAAAGCDLVALRTDAAGDARAVFERWAFEPAYEQALWTAP